MARLVTILSRWRRWISDVSTAARYRHSSDACGGVLDGEGFITFDFRMTTDGQGFWGMRLDRIEVIDLNDGDESTKHRIHQMPRRSLVSMMAAMS